MDETLSEIFGKIDAYLYNYNQEAKDKYEDENMGVDEAEHIGPIAQELKENPVTASTVEENENGDLEVNIQQLVFVLTGVLADLSKRVDAIENKLERF